jgi:hypothetical protein
MRRLIALLAVVALSITLFSPPAAATCPDPSKPVPWMDRSASPSGDGGSWADVDSSPGPSEGFVIGIWSKFDFYISNFTFLLVVYISPDSHVRLDENGTAGKTSLGRSRGSSSR